MDFKKAFEGKEGGRRVGNLDPNRFRGVHGTATPESEEGFGLVFTVRFGPGLNAGKIGIRDGPVVNHDVEGFAKERLEAMEGRQGSAAFVGDEEQAGKALFLEEGGKGGGILKHEG